MNIGNFTRKVLQLGRDDDYDDYDDDDDDATKCCIFLFSSIIMEYKPIQAFRDVYVIINLDVYFRIIFISL